MNRHAQQQKNQKSEDEKNNQINFWEESLLLRGNKNMLLFPTHTVNIVNSGNENIRDVITACFQEEISFRKVDNDVLVVGLNGTTNTRIERIKFEKLVENGKKSEKIHGVPGMFISFGFIEHPNYVEQIKSDAKNGDDDESSEDIELESNPGLNGKIISSNETFGEEDTVSKVGDDKKQPNNLPFGRAPLLMIEFPLSTEYPFFQKISNDADFQVNMDLLEILGDDDFRAKLENVQKDLNDGVKSSRIDCLMNFFENLEDKKKLFRLGFEINIISLDFSRRILYDDIKNSNELLKRNDHPILSEYFFYRGKAYQGEIDKSFTVFPTPFQSDVSQRQIIRNVLKTEKSMVIQGPPGTGKTQTIANIIAMQFLQKKRVLFVCEKQAAMEVVLQKLRELGLDSLSLDIFKGGSDVSNKVKNNFKESKGDKQPDISFKPSELETLNFEKYHESLENLIMDYKELINDTEDFFEPEIAEECLYYFIHDELKGKIKFLLPLNKEKTFRDSCSNALGVLEGISKENEIFLQNGKIKEMQDLETELKNLVNIATEKNWFTRDDISFGLNNLKKEQEIVKKDIKNEESSSYSSIEFDKLEDRLKKNYRLHDLLKISDADLELEEDIAAWSWFKSLWDSDVKNKFKHSKACVEGFLNARRNNYHDCGNENILKVDVIELKNYKDCLSVKLQFEKKKKENLKELHDKLNGLNDNEMKEDFLNSMEQVLRSANFEFNNLDDLNKVLGFIDKLNHIEKNLREVFQPSYLNTAQSLNTLKEKLKHLRLLSFDDLKKMQAIAKKYKEKIDFIEKRIRKYSFEDAICFLNKSKHKDFFQKSDEIKEYLAETSKQMDVKTEEMRRKIKDIAKKWGPPLKIKEWSNSNQKTISFQRMMKRDKDFFTHVLQFRPIMLMSPTCVAECLPSKCFEDLEKDFFDCLIIDEASQLREEHCIGAIARAKQVIVFGDKQQLPPTEAFQKNKVESEDVISYSNILLSLDSKPVVLAKLNWHYRSVDESLISFSNRHFYDEKLLTFPSPSKHEDEGLELRYVEDGCVENQSNKNEAEKVVTEVLHIIKKNPNADIAIIAVTSKQKDCIDSILKKKITSETKKLEKAAKLGGSNPKSPIQSPMLTYLEASQGFEADIVLISLNYGRAKNTESSRNFLGREGDKNRLNVMFSRAKKKMIVFSSMKSSDVSTKGKHDGRLFLEKFLSYAENYQICKSEKSSSSSSSDVTLSDFLTFLKSKIGNCLNGTVCEVHHDIGSGMFKIDFGIYDPNRKVYLLGIMLDGNNLHECLNGDDSLFQNSIYDGTVVVDRFLISRGWRIHRIWMADLARNFTYEIEKIYSQFQNSITELEECEKSLREKELKELESYKQSLSDDDESLGSNSKKRSSSISQADSETNEIETTKKLKGERHTWTNEQDQRLMSIGHQYPKQWKRIAKDLFNDDSKRTRRICETRFKNLSKTSFDEKRSNLQVSHDSLNNDDDDAMSSPKRSNSVAYQDSSKDDGSETEDDEAILLKSPF